MVRSSRAIVQALLLGLPVCLFGTASGAPNSGSGGTGATNFTCNAEVGLCECEGDKNSLDCKAMRRNCKDVDDLFSTESPHDKGKLFCVMTKQGRSGTKPGSGTFLRDVPNQAPAAAADTAADPAGRGSLGAPARAASKRSEP